MLLDADGVVQLAAPGFRASLEVLCGQSAQTEAFLADLFAAERECVTRKADFRPALADVLVRWGARVSVDDALAVWQQIEPNQEVLDVVAPLRAVGACLRPGGWLAVFWNVFHDPDRADPFHEATLELLGHLARSPRTSHPSVYRSRWTNRRGGETR